MPSKCALVIGAGRGIGSHVGAKFAENGYVACLVRRSKPDLLAATVEEINARPNQSAKAFLCDATKEAEVNKLVDDIETNIGPIEVLVYNLGANMGIRDLEATSPKVFRRALDLGVFGGFLAAKAVAPRMEHRGQGTIIYTGATAGMRGNVGQMAHSAGMFARRGMLQSLANEFWPKGIHVAHCVVDGLVDAPDTVGVVYPEMFKKAKEEMEKIENIVKPRDVADAYWYLHNQSKGCWTFEFEVRPWKDKAWYNSTMANL